MLQHTQPQLLQLLPSSRLNQASRQDPPATGCRIFQLNARFQSAGVWAGVSQLIEAAYLGLLDLGENRIVEQHAYELYMALPSCRDRIRPRYLCLTDTATSIEKTRFYPMERAYRLVHGLVGMVLHWKATLRDTSQWVVVVRNFDDAQHLATRFIAELARRATHPHEIHVIVETQSDLTDLSGRISGMLTRPAATWIAALPPEPQAHRYIDYTQARLLETRISNASDATLEQEYPTLLEYYRATSARLPAAELALQVMALYNRRGYYHEAKSFLDIIIPRFHALVGTDEVKRMNSVSEMNSCLVATNEAERALRVVTHLAMPYLTRPHLVANMNYILAMHHLRYAEAKDIDQAEQHISQAVDDIRAAKDGPEATEHPFLTAFINNGLAFLRVRQKRHQDALDLCRNAYQSVTAGLGEDRHLLHRSVLQYNMAQVYVMLGRHEEGLQCYNRAISMDPYYSEYHAETGDILQQLDRYPEAIEAYAKALQYSPPYPEVYFNKAVCHARQQEWPDALACSGISLELNPDQPDLHAARAEIFAELGQPDAALAEYDSAIALAADSIAMRVNRAVLHFNNGSYDLALSDMNHVIGQEPHEPAHYENRAAIYQAMNRQDLYLLDLDIAERRKELA